MEDNVTLREQLMGALEELTCVRVVGSCGTEDEAIAWLATSDSWDLLVVDLFLKQGSGMGLVRRVARRRPEQRVVVFSNYVNAGVRKWCAQVGVDAVFDKSTDIDALVDYCARRCAQLPAPVQPAQA